MSSRDYTAIHVEPVPVCSWWPIHAADDSDRMNAVTTNTHDGHLHEPGAVSTSLQHFFEAHTAFAPSTSFPL